MADLIFVGQFIAAKVGKTGLAVTVDVDRYALVDGTRTALVTAGNATEGRRGLYHYRLAGADLSLYQYVATFITADATVDQQHVATLGMVVPDTLVSSRSTFSPSNDPVALVLSAGLAADAVNASAVATDAVAKIQSGLALEETAQMIKVKTDNLPSDPADQSAIEAAITAATSPLATAASIMALNNLSGAEVWSHGNRTLTQPLPTQEQQETEQGIRIVRALTFQHTWSGVALPPNWSKLIWTIKDAKYYLANDDKNAIAQVVLSDPASETDGLVRLINAKTVNKQFGILAFDEGQGTVSLEINDDATVVFPVTKTAKYDLKVLKADGRSERLLIGDAIISPTVTLEADEPVEDEPE